MTSPPILRTRPEKMRKLQEKDRNEIYLNNSGKNNADDEVIRLEKLITS